MQRDALGLLKDMRDAADYFAEDTLNFTFDAFMADRRTHQAVERNFEIIGEAVNRLRRHDHATAERISAYRQIVLYRTEESESTSSTRIVTSQRGV